MIKTVNASPFMSALKGALASLIISTALMLICAIPLTNSSELDMLTSVLPKVIQAISALVGGILTSKTARNSTVLCGLLCGTMYGAVIVIGSLIMGSFNIVYSVICLFVSALASLLGAVFGVPKEKDEKSRRRAMMKKFG